MTRPVVLHYIGVLLEVNQVCSTNTWLCLPESELKTVPSTAKVSGAMTLTAIIYPGEETNVRIAQNPETGTITQGKTVQEAMDNLKEAVALYLGEFPLQPRSNGNLFRLLRPLPIRS